MRAIVALALGASLVAYAGVGGAEPPVGQFFQAGMTSVEGPTLSVQWLYGFKFNIDPATVTKVTLSCNPIPGTDVTVAGPDLKIRPNGVGLWRGPVLQVAKATTAWMLDMSTSTDATCKAVITRAGQPDATVTAPVHFSPASKASTLAQLKTAFEYNSKLRQYQAAHPTSTPHSSAQNPV